MPFAAVRYRPEQRQAWDAFAAASPQGTFLHARAFLEHHPTPIPDHSALVYEGTRLLALLPAHAEGDAWHSHRGLSYGGLLWAPDAGLAQALGAWQALAAYGRRQGFRHLHYKPVPSFLPPSGQHLDALPLHLLRAERTQLEINMVVEGYAPERWQQRRHRGLKRARNAGLEWMESPRLEDFWPLLEDNLRQRHGTAPVHALPTILALREAFPTQIALAAVGQGNRMLGGCVLFRHARAWHAQYIASTPQGREQGALDLLFSEVLRRMDVPRLSLGVSTLRPSGRINAGLLAWKASWGAQAWPHEQYRIGLAGAPQLEGWLQ